MAVGSRSDEICQPTRSPLATSVRGFTRTFAFWAFTCRAVVNSTTTKLSPFSLPVSLTVPLQFIRLFEEAMNTALFNNDAGLPVNSYFQRFASTGCAEI